MRAIPGRRFDWDDQGVVGPAARHRRALRRRRPRALARARRPRRRPRVAARGPDALARARHDPPRGRRGRVPRPHARGRPARGPRRARARGRTTARRRCRFADDVAELLSDLRGARLDHAAASCALRLRVGPRAAAGRARRRAHGGGGAPVARGALGRGHRRGVRRLPGVERRSRTLPIDPWALEPLEEFLRLHEVAIAATARPVLARMRAEHDEAIEAVRRSRAPAAPSRCRCAWGRASSRRSSGPACATC